MREGENDRDRKEVNEEDKKDAEKIWENDGCGRGEGRGRADKTIRPVMVIIC